MHFDAQTRREDAGSGVVGEEPAGAELTRQGQGLGLSEVEKAATSPFTRLFPSGVRQLGAYQPWRQAVRPRRDSPSELPLYGRRHDDFAGLFEELEGVRLVKVEDRTGVGDDKPQPGLPFCSRAHAMSSRWNCS